VRKLKLFFFFGSILAFFLILPIQADIYYSANEYEFTFNSFGTAMAFDSDIVFDRAYRENEFWYFNTSTVSSIGFQVQVATLLVTDFFAADVNTLVFTVTATSGTSTTKIWVGTRGQPSDVVGESSWSYDSETKIITITRIHDVATYEISVVWGGGDSTPPTYSNIAHNTTVENQVCQFSSYWDDNIALSKFIFSWNGTGSWTNNSAVSFSGTPAWANVTKTLPAAGTKVGYRWYANDTSNNWAVTSIYVLITTVVGQNVVVLLNEPGDGETDYANAESFTYTPIFSQTIQNASLWANVSGSWQIVAWNASSITNNTANSISYSFADSGSYLWNIAAYNTTHAIFGQYNRTLTKSLEPRYSNVAHSTTTVEESCTFISLWEDGDGLSGFIFGWNKTGSWTNETWTAFSGNLAAEVETLPAASGIVLGYKFYANDTDNKWTTTTIYTFMTTLPTSEGGGEDEPEPEFTPTDTTTKVTPKAEDRLLKIILILGVIVIAVIAVVSLRPKY